MTADGRVVAKAAELIADDAQVEAKAAHPWVGRGALKLLHALELWPIAMQERVATNPTHAFLGQWYVPVALRKNITGNLESPVILFWNIEKK